MMLRSTQHAAIAADHANSLPAEIDPHYYRQRYVDLRHMTDGEAAHHYRTHGVGEGRQASPFADRQAFFGLVERLGSVLEIGPLANPAVRGDNIKYFDVLPTEALKQKARAHKLDVAACPQIDFVSSTGDLAVVMEQFDGVVSSHAIEHQPDLVSHLVGVARILNPGGRYFLAIPDKRFCFDHFIAESTIADVLDASVRKLKLHDIAAVIQHIALTTHNDPGRHWGGDYGQPAYRDDPEKIREGLNICLQNPNVYIDTHAWQFIPESFQEIATQLFELGFSPLQVLRVYPTIRGSNEFYAILGKTQDDIAQPFDGWPNGFDDALYLRANPDVAKAGMDPRQHYLRHGRREGRKLRP